MEGDGLLDMELANPGSPKLRQHSAGIQGDSQIPGDRADVRASSTINANLDDGPNVFKEFDVMNMDGPRREMDGFTVTDAVAGSFSAELEGAEAWRGLLDGSGQLGKGQADLFERWSDAIDGPNLGFGVVAWAGHIYLDRCNVALWP